MAYPALRTTKEDDNVDFSAFFSFNSSHQLISSSKSTRVRILLVAFGAFGALGAECLSTPNRFRE